MSKLFSLSESASIAIHGIALLAKAGKALSLKEIAESINCSKNHLASVFQILTKNGLIEAERGPNGGYTLKKRNNEITLLEVFEIVEGKLDYNDCKLSCEACPFRVCIFGGKLKQFAGEFKEFLKSTKLSDI